MDFMNHGNRPVQQNTNGQPATNGFGPINDGPKPPQKPAKSSDKAKWIRVGQFAFLVALVVLVVAVVFSIATGDKKTVTTNSVEASKVKSNQLQAVFLNGGQVYFGKISAVNSRSLTLDTIYYLRVNQQVQPGQTDNANANDISLVKLGCELHGPEDTMVINREQIVFWENLKTDGQVAKAVEEYNKANPNGQKCNEQNQQSSTTPGTTNNTGTGAATNR